MLSLTTRTLLLASVLLGNASALAPDIAELCPFSNFCKQTTNRSLDDPSLQPCCLPCSCSPDCATVGKCCPDVDGVLDPEHVYPCRTQESIYKSYLNTSGWQSSKLYGYRMINQCPTEVHHNPELSESVSRCHNAAGVEDLIFATGNVSGHTYLNKHCAVCNNEPAYTEWDLYIITDLLITPGLKFDERDRRIMNDGGVVSVPPTHDIALRALCRDTGFVQTCNVTGEWDVYDFEIEQRCHDATNQFEYFAGLHYRFQAYANVYCYLCNIANGSQVPAVCPLTDLTVPHSQRHPLFPLFSALLIPNPPQKQISTLTPCERADIWDPIRMRCTALLCPPATISQGGECVPLVDDVVNYSVSVIMQVLLTTRPGETHSTSPQTSENSQRTSSGNSQTSDNSQHANNGEPQTSDNTQHTNNGDPKTNDNTQHTSSGNSQTNDNTQQTNNGDPLTRDNTQQTNNGDPLTRDNTQQTNNGDPLTRDNTQQTNNGDPLTRDNTQQTNNGDPLTRDSTQHTNSGSGTSGNPTLDNNIEYDTMLNDLRLLTKSHINNDKVQCGICKLELLGNNDSGNMYMTAIFLTTKSCTRTDINKGLFNLFKTSSQNVTLRKSNISVNLVNLKSIDTIGPTKSLLAQIKIGRMCPMENVFFINETIFCPSINLNMGDTHDLTEPYNTRIRQRSVDAGNGTVRLCVDTYISIMNGGQSRMAAGANNRHWLTLVICYIIVTATVFGAHSF